MQLLLVCGSKARGWRWSSWRLGVSHGTTGVLDGQTSWSRWPKAEAESEIRTWNVFVGWLENLGRYGWMVRRMDEALHRLVDRLGRIQYGEYATKPNSD